MRQESLHEQRDRRDDRDEAQKQARRTGVYLGSEFCGGGGIPMTINERGNIVPMPGYLEAARNRRRERMGARIEIEYDVLG